MNEPIKKRRYQECRHFNGIQHECCKAGVKYKSVTLGFLTDGQKQGFPCLGPGGTHNRDGATCDKYDGFTRAELEAQRKEMEAMTRNLVIALDAIQLHVGGPYKRGEPFKSGCIDCPVCGESSCLQYMQVGYNGHLRFRCSTEGCVKGME